MYLVAFGAATKKPEMVWEGDTLCLKTLVGIGQGGIVGEASTLEEARKMRVAPCDLVFDKETGKIVSDNSWLHGWERAADNSYAREMLLKEAEIFWL